jgi:hypothetical protein
VGIGADDKVFYGGFSLDGAAHVGDGPLWVHGAVFLGSPSQLFSETVSGSYSQVRGGFELRSCTPSGRACAAGGVDLGYRQMSYEGRGGLFDDDSMSSAHDASAIVVPRVQLDFGGEELRIRPSFEGVYGMSGVNGFQMGLAVAVQM